MLSLALSIKIVCDYFHYFHSRIVKSCRRCRIKFWPLSVSQIVGFFNQPYLQNKSMKQPDFQLVDTNSHKLKVDQNVYCWAWSEMGVASLVSALQNEQYLNDELMKYTDFSHVMANSEKLKVMSIIFGWVWSRMSMAIYLMRPQNLLYLKNEFLN